MMSLAEMLDALGRCNGSVPDELHAEWEAWPVGLRARLTEEAPAEVRHLVEILHGVRRLWAEQRTEQPVPAMPTVELPEEFWTCRPKHALIRQAAQAAMIAPAVAVGGVLAKVMALSPGTRLPGIVGGPGSLDYVAGLVGRSGQGKSVPLWVIDQLIPTPPEAVWFTRLGIGSGEGIADNYFGDVFEEQTGKDGKTKTVKTRTQVRRSIMFLADEGGLLKALTDRRGATLWETVRTAWSGMALGQANADEAKRRQLDAGSYRFTLLAGWQPSVAADVLRDTSTGTAQRWVLFSAVDPSAPDQRPPMPLGIGGASDLRPFLWQPQLADAGMLEVAAEVEAEIVRDRSVYLRGRGDEASSHRNYLKLKTAGGLRLLDHEHGLVITVEDWALAEMIIAASDALRALVLQAGDQAEAAEDTRAGVRFDRRRRAEGDALMDRVAAVMARHADGHFPRQLLGMVDKDATCSRRCLAKSVRSSDRSRVDVDATIARAAELGWVLEVAEGRWVAGPVAPPQGRG